MRSIKVKKLGRTNTSKVNFLVVEERHNGRESTVIVTVPVVAGTVDCYLDFHNAKVRNNNTHIGADDIRDICANMNPFLEEPPRG